MNPKTNATATRMGRRCSHTVVRRNLRCREGVSSWVFGGVWGIGMFDSMDIRRLTDGGWLGLTGVLDKMCNELGCENGEEIGDLMIIGSRLRFFGNCLNHGLNGLKDFTD